MKPLVSVVIPSYNHARFVEEAIRSVFAQTHSNLELIVVDDGSKDGSAELIPEILKQARAGMKTCFFGRENEGAHAAINFGLSKAQGEFITVLNSDDYYHPARIETLLAAAGASGSELILSLLEMVSESGERLSGSVREVLWYHQAVSLRHYLPTLGFALIRDNIAVTTGNLFFSKRLLDTIGPFRPYRYMHDIDFVLRALAHTEPKLVSKSLLYYRLHSANTIREQKMGFEEEGHRILTDYFKVAGAGGMPNRFAPCQEYWPRYFNTFLAEQHPFYSYSKLSHLFEQGEPGQKGHASGGALEHQAIPSLAGVSIQVLDRVRESTEPLRLLGHSFDVEWYGTRIRAELAPPTGADGLQAIALVHEDRILATARGGTSREGMLECTFVVGSEFGPLDLRRARFLLLEEGPQGISIHAGAEPAPEARLEVTANPALEPVRVFVGDRPFDIRTGGTEGRIDRVRSTEEGDWILEGQAFENVSGEVPIGVLLFDGDSRLPARFEVDRAGFRLVIQKSTFSESGSSVLRAFALFRRGIAFHLGLVAREGRELSANVRCADYLHEHLERISRTASGWRYDGPQGSREWVIGRWSYGYVDLIDRSPARVTIHGWAIEPPTGLMPECILITADGTPVAFTRLNTERPDLTRAHKLWSPLIAGFRLDLEPSLASAEIKAHALWASGTATELPEYGANPTPRPPVRQRSASESPQLSV